MPADLRVQIRTRSQENPLWGAPRIHGELLKLGLHVSQVTVTKYMARPATPPPQSRRTFLANHRVVGGQPGGKKTMVPEGPRTVNAAVERFQAAKTGRISWRFARLIGFPNEAYGIVPDAEN
jgi:hypothetical protein